MDFFALSVGIKTLGRANERVPSLRVHWRRGISTLDLRVYRRVYLRRRTSPPGGFGRFDTCVRLQWGSVSALIRECGGG